MTYDNDSKQIKPVKNHKVLGWTMNNRLTMDLHLSNTIKAANLKLTEIKPYFKYMSLKNKARVVNAQAMSLFKYGISQYLGANVDVKNRLTTSMMNIWRITRGYIPHRMSNEDVLEDLKQEHPSQIILKESTKLIHKVIKTE